MTPLSPSIPRKSGPGCFFYGCITTIVLCIVLAVVAFFGGRAALRGMVNSYTQTTRMELKKVVMTDEEMAALTQRIQAFTQALDAQQPGAQLVLNERELNAYITTKTEAKDSVYVMLEGDQIKGQISYPLGDMGFMDLTGRYLNGEATFTVTLQNGVLFVMANSLSVAGQALPDAFMEGFKKENLAKEAGKDKELTAMLAKLESISVAGGSVTLTGKAAK